VELDACANFRNNTVHQNSTASSLNNASGVRLNDACGAVVGNIIVENRGFGHGVGLIVPPGAEVVCNDVWGDDVDELPAPYVSANFSTAPLFCAVDPASTLSFALRSNSPCAPHNTPVEACGLVGAEEVGCGAVAVEKKRWQDLKRLFR
jgi:hypothetical protein